MLYYWENSHSNMEIFAGVCHLKTDMVSAFWIIPNSLNQHFLLILKAKHLVTGVTYYFIDKCLPFGHSTSCAIFQEFSDALTHVMEYRSGFLIIITNYLDDFLFMSYTIEKCNQLMQKFIDLC